MKERKILTVYDSWRPPTSHYDPEFRSSSWGSKPSPRSSSSSSSTTSHRTKFSTRGSRILYTQLGVSISISIPSIDSIICIPKRREQRTPYQSTPVSLRDIDLEMPSPSIPCWQSLEMIYIDMVSNKRNVIRLAKDHPKNSPWVFKSDKGKRDSASIVLQFNIPDFSIFVEEILNVSLLDIHGKIPHIDPAIRHGGWVSGTADTEWGHLQTLRSLLVFHN